MNLERQCSSAGHWGEQQYRQLFPPGDKGVERLVLVAEDSSPARELASVPHVVGFLVARHLASEWELENLVVAHDVRRNGIGQQLLNALLAAAGKTTSDSVFLEVRESNTAARALYEKAGFELGGRRVAYYTDPIEDAVLYQRRLS
jgi:ribosomal-protein-alanine N-acetyltransferase